MLRTLVVEDNEINLQVAIAFLSRLGHTVETALSGEIALKLFDFDKYHAILMDCHMPGIDGYQTTAAIRGRETQAGRKPVHIIALTADVGYGSRERCLAAGMNDYLSKPISMAEFRHALERVPALEAAAVS